MATVSEIGQGTSPKVDLMLQVGGDDGAKQCEASDKLERGRRRWRALSASTELLGGTMAGGGSASALLASRRSEGGGRARAEGSRASSTSRRPARGMVKASRVRGSHAAAIF